MAERYTYLLIDLLCIVVPFLASFHPRIAFYKQWKAFWLPCLATAAIFIAWDAAFTAAGIWSFNPRYITGYRLFGLPLEEIGFFICIPYACVFTYYCVSRFTNTAHLQAASVYLSVVLAAVLLIVACLNYYRLYTSITFAATALLLLSLLQLRVAFLPQFFCAFLLIVIPFLVSNGALTGSFTEEPVVIYNNAHNLSLRIFTIPVEDTFYAMLLLLLNVWGFEYLSRRRMELTDISFG